MELAMSDEAKAAAPAPRPSGVPPVIGSHEQALEVAGKLATGFAVTASERDRGRDLPWSEVEQFSQSGLWGVTVPKDFGGPALGSKTVTDIISTIGAADGSLSQTPQNHFYALEVLRVGGSWEQKRFFYDRVLAGERFGNALAEIGNKDFKRRTTLRRENGDWIVNGRKFYSTGAIFAHWIPTLAIAQQGGKQVSYLVMVPRASEGVAVIDDWDGFGQRLTGSGSVLFDDVRVEERWIIPFQASFDTPTTIGPFAQLMHAAIDYGIGVGAHEEMKRFVRERARPWIDANVGRASDDPLTVSAVGQVNVKLKAAAALLRRASRFVDDAQSTPTEATVAAASVAVAEARILTTKAGLLAATKLFELSGTSATASELNLDRYWRNVRTHTLHDPVRWKYQAIGNYYLNERAPPRHGVI
ncbi:SfnB family sulfur acquisition oxidoreductase [Rhizobium lentis]|nr:SfnB family sulfur acquisition oxidoreductase [Rhizobium lentis]